MFEAYELSFLGLWMIAVTMIVQLFVATGAHRRQKKSIPGVMDSTLGQKSFVFRSHRVHQNSLENIPPMLALSIIAILIGIDANRLAIAIWVYAVARIIYTALYYAIATEKNPSPRSYFFGIALFANLFLVYDVAMALIS